MILCKNCPAFPLSILSNLDDSQIEDIKQNSITITYKKGQDIVVNGQNNQGLFCIRSGVIKLHLGTPQEESITLGIKNQGGVFGHFEMMEDTVLLSASCLTDVAVCFFPKKTILTSYEQIPVLNTRIMKELNADLAEIIMHLIALTANSIKQRTARAILYLKKKTGIAEGGSIALRLSRKEFSSFTGGTRETVTRALTSLKEQGCIAIDGQKLSILDEEMLRKIAKKRNKI